MPKGGTAAARARARVAAGASVAVTRTFRPPTTGFRIGDFRAVLDVGAAFGRLAAAGLKLDAATVQRLRRSFNSNVRDRIRDVRLVDGSTVRGVSASNLRTFAEFAARAASRADGTRSVSARLVGAGEDRPRVPGFRITGESNVGRPVSRDVPMVTLAERLRRRR